MKNYIVVVRYLPIGYHSFFIDVVKIQAKNKKEARAIAIYTTYNKLCDVSSIKVLKMTKITT